MIEARVISKKETLFEVGEDVVVGWQMEVHALEQNPTRTEIVPGPLILTTLLREEADRYQVGDDITLALGPSQAPKKKLIVPGVN